eukprot:c46291_g1_i1 orf=182-430(+)
MCRGGSTLVTCEEGLGNLFNSSDVVEDSFVPLREDSSMPLREPKYEDDGNDVSDGEFGYVFKLSSSSDESEYHDFSDTDECS